MWKTYSAEGFSGMHHIRLRCGLRAFFFECLAHSLVGERVDIGQLDHMLGEKPQRPARPSLGRGLAGERDQLGFLGPIQLALIGVCPRAVGSQRRLQALLDKALAQPLDGGDACMEGLGDPLVRPARTTVGLIRLEQDLGVLETAHVCLAPRQQPLKLLALLTRERYPILLGHGWPPEGSDPHHQQKRQTPRLSSDRPLVRQAYRYLPTFHPQLRDAYSRPSGTTP